MRYSIAIFIIFISVISLLPGCQEPEPLRVGFLGGLTARAAGLSISGRDGFLLAIEEVNASGGINGVRVEGLIQDTRLHRETALQAVNRLIEKKVSAIVGPMTSQTAVTIVPEINRAKIPMVSPTVSTNQLSGLDDFFFRVYYTNAQAAKLLANRLSLQKDLRRIAVIYDLNNSAYTEDWVRNFQESLEQSGGSIVADIPFDFHSNTLFLDLASQATGSEPQAILILANAIDTAMICQQLAKNDRNIPIYATGWSYSDDLFQFGGKSVEGLTIIQSANLNDSSPKMQEFVQAYQKRFRTSPNFPALHSYDATQMVLETLKKATTPLAIREELLKMKLFPGTQSDLSVDRFGDLKHPHLNLAQIKNGQFVATD